MLAYEYIFIHTVWTLIFVGLGYYGSCKIGSHPQTFSHVKIQTRAVKVKANDANFAVNDVIAHKIVTAS